MKHNDLPLRSRYRLATTLLLAASFLAPGHATADLHSSDWTVREASAQSTQRRTPTRTRSARRTRPAPAPALTWSSPTGAGALSTDLDAILGEGGRSGKWGVLAVSLTRGDTLYSVNPDEMLQPASTMKLFTAALSLDQFSPSHQFSTDVLRTGSVDGFGTLSGDLVIRGGGDPGLSKRFLPGGQSGAVDSLAALIAAAGITRVRGRLIADATAFDAQRIPEGWQSRYLHATYAARVSALSLNENLAIIAVSPGAIGNSPVAAVEPLSSMAILNKARTVRGSRARIVILPRPDGGVELRGTIGSRAGTQRYQVVVEEPALFTAGALRLALADRGIIIDGETIESAAPVGAVRVASLHSVPLRELLAVMNRESINHFAELLFRNAGRSASERGVGTVETANELLQSFMVSKVGARPGSVYAADGSGLSVLDRTTPRALVQLLEHAHREPWGETFHASLPVAGESELLANRMKRTPAQGNLHAKTGTTNTVASLAGYVTALNGELLAFAFIYNGRELRNARVSMDRMGSQLASFYRE